MAENTAIAYARYTWSPWLVRSTVRRKTSDAYWKTPLTWNRQAADRCESTYDGMQCTMRLGHEGDHRDYTPAGGLGVNEPQPTRPRVFSSQSDPFEDFVGPIVDAKGRLLICNNDNPRYVPAISDYDREEADRATLQTLRGDMFRLIRKTQNLDYILATKRPENILPMWPLKRPWPLKRWEFGERDDPCPVHIPNVWLLYSASDKETLEAGISHLLECRDLVPVLGLLLDPLVGPVEDIFCDTQRWTCPDCGDPDVDVDVKTDEGKKWRCRACGGDGSGEARYETQIDWVVVGGESGPNARPCALEWIDDIRRQCEAARVRLFVKQVGSKPAIADRIRVGGPAAGMFCHWTAHKGSMIRPGETELYIGRPKHPKGADPTEWPPEMRVQQYPEVKHG